MAVERGAVETGNVAARLLAGITIAFLVLLPVGIVVDFVLPGQLANELRFNAHGLCELDKAGVPLPFRLGAMVLMLFAAGFIEWALYSVYRILRLCGRGAAISSAVFSYLKNIGVALFAGTIVDIALRVPVSMILSWSLGAGHRYASFGVNSQDALILFAACALFVIARAMADAARAPARTDPAD